MVDLYWSTVKPMGSSNGGLFSLCTNSSGVMLRVANYSEVYGVVNKQVDSLIAMSDGWSFHVVGSDAPRDFGELTQL